MGLLGLGVFRTTILISPKFPFAVISCLFTEAAGSAIILTFVASIPTPAKLRTAATLTFAGNYFTASLAVPS